MFSLVRSSGGAGGPFRSGFATCDWSEQNRGGIYILVVEPKHVSWNSFV